MELFFDVETSGFIKKELAPGDPDQAWIMQLAYILSDESRIYTEFNSLIYAGDRVCSPGAQKIHNISVKDCNWGGVPENILLDILYHSFFNAHILVAHNYSFDIEFIANLLQERDVRQIPYFCTMRESTDFCAIPGRFGRPKWPKLTELYKILFNEEIEDAHDALADVRATRKCYYKLKEIL